MAKVWTAVVAGREFASYSCVLKPRCLRRSGNDTQRETTDAGRANLHGKEGVDGSSPSEGWFRKAAMRLLLVFKPVVGLPHQ